MKPDALFEFRGDNKRFLECRDREAILSGPAETGKTLAGLFKLHTLLTLPKYAGMQAALLRMVYADIPGTVLRTYCRDILGVDSPKLSRYVKFYGGNKPEWADYPNGSRLWIGGLDNPGKTLSGERDVIYLVQAEQAPVNVWQYLIRATTGRGAVMPYTQLLGDCNPAGKTHWILKRAEQGRLKLYTSTHKDNPTLWDNVKGEWTEQGLRTIADLSSLDGALYKRLYQGLWAAPEGMIYDIFDDARHVVKAFGPPKSWPRVVGVDPFGDNVAAVWLALDLQNGVWNVYREYSEGFGATTAGHAQAMLDLSAGESIFYWCGGGPSERQARADFAGAGVPLLPPATSDVWSQINTVYAMLKGFELVIHDSCEQLISEIGEYHRKEKGGEVIGGTIAEKERFHVLDALRYGVTGPEMGEQRRYGTMRRSIGY